MEILKSIAKFFDRIDEIREKRSKRIIYAVTVVILGSIVVGVISGLVYTIPTSGFPDVNTCRAFHNNFLHFLIGTRQFPFAAAYIFFNNLKVSLLLGLSGITLILVLPLNALFSGTAGFIIGTCLPLTPLNLDYLVVSTFAESLVIFLENLAYILASVEGIYMGMALFFPKRLYGKRAKRKESFLKTANESSYIFVLVAIIIAMSAIIETLLLAFEYYYFL